MAVHCDLLQARRRTKIAADQPGESGAAPRECFFAYGFGEQDIERLAVACCW
jgi:hypothetical protein